MVGFGSSLRMSRRRGWEDAYLDYPSLRLLLTQIEAAYEEEDWKASAAAGGDGGGGGGGGVGVGVGDGGRGGVGSGGGGGGGNGGGGEGAASRPSGGDGGPWWRRIAARAIAAAGGDVGRLGGPPAPAPAPGAEARGGRRGRSRPGAWADDVIDSEEEYVDAFIQGGWNSSEDFSPRKRRSRGRRGGRRVRGSKDDDDGGRALDRGGWRSPGAQDYRDELFLENNFVRLGAEVGYFFPEQGDQTEDSPESRLGFLEKQSTENSGRMTIIGENSVFYESPGPSSARGSAIDGEGGGILQTPDSQSSPGDTTPGHRVQFSDSPGVLEAGYETFAAAAARTGYASPGDGKTLTVGSPSEEGGWLDFLPNLFSVKGKGGGNSPPAALSSSEVNPLLLPSRGSLFERGSSRVAANPSSFVARDTPHRYTHFSEAFPVHGGDGSTEKTGRRPPPSPPRFDVSSFDAEAAAPSAVPAGIALPEPDCVTPLASGRKSFPVEATALGHALPKTPATPMTPGAPPNPQLRHKSRPDSSISATGGGGGFGVSLRMLPAESPGLLLRAGEEGEDEPGMSQFYSFRDRGRGDDHDDNNERLASSWLGSQSTEEEQLGYGDAGGEGGGVGNRAAKEEENARMRVSNMISFYSGGELSLLSPPEPVARGAGRRSGRRSPPSSSERSSSDVGGSFVLSLLFGRPKESKTDSATRRDRSRKPTSSSDESGDAQRRKSKVKRTAGEGRAPRNGGRRRGRRRRRPGRGRRQCVPGHLLAAHARAAAITERYVRDQYATFLILHCLKINAFSTLRFRGLLRAEVEKVILFANSRLGELSDTIGSLRYASYEDGQEEMRKKYPSLADGGISNATCTRSFDYVHQLSSSEDGDSGLASDASLSSDDMPARNQPDDDADEDRRSVFKRESREDTRKQIILRDRLRISRPMFQKADFLGEDFSLLSAVDEADAYTAVGVELMHLLKYVCVNIVAARKICKKHDRLLSNRMLGGYYQRLAAEANRSHNNRKDGQHRLLRLKLAHPQFGGTLSNPSAPQSNGYILGIYDTKIQHIANSTTMQTVSCSLAIALSDFEASQSRSALLGLGFGSKSESNGSEKAVSTQQQHEVPSPKHKALTRSRIRDAVNYQISGQCFRGDEDSTDASQEGSGDENASTSSNTALTRLQFVVTSIFGLREAARFKSVPFEHYSSRLLQISMGQNVYGDGLDGCSRETLDFLCSYQPDAAYTLDVEELYNSLKVVGRGKGGIGDVLVASLAAAAKGYETATDRSRFRKRVASAMSINPQATGEEDAPSFRNIEYQNALRINAASMILYLFNYYIIVPTAHLYSSSLLAPSATAALIGTANISSILSSFIHTLLLSKRRSFIKKRRLDLGNFRLPLIFSDFCGLAGNILYSYSLKISQKNLSHLSLGMAFAGRFLVGLGSAETLNRQLLLSVLPQESVNAEVASLVKKSMIAMALALLLGSFVDIRVKDRSAISFQNDNLNLDDRILSSTLSPTPANQNQSAFANASAVQPFPSPLPFDSIPPTTASGHRGLFSLESIGYFMAFAWFVHLILMMFFFDGPKIKGEEQSVHLDELKSRNTQDEDFDSDTETVEQEWKAPNAFTDTNPFKSHSSPNNPQPVFGTFEKLQTMSRKARKQQTQHTYMESIANIRALLFSHVAYPTTLAILFITKTTAEALLSSCGTIAFRYFKWSGARSGLLMALMSMMILPINMFLAAQRNYPERGVMKDSLQIARYGLFFMVNYESIVLFVMSPKKYSWAWYYDGIFGAPQYILSFACVFLTITVLESVTLSLMSKVQVAPRQMKKYSIDNAFMVSLVASTGRLMGDLLMFTFDISSWMLFNDIVNALCFTLVIAVTAGIFVVRKHYFFLI
ncbi:hypothetical protein ACHAWF_015723 [Thalassiosira exigua]